MDTKEHEPESVTSSVTGARQAFIGVGANLGDRAGALIGAIEQLRTTAEIRVLGCSSIYETSPVGVTDQPNFLNQVVGIETSLAPEALLQRLQSIEQAFGRVRTLRWGPRTLDLDLLAYEGERRDTAELTLPHPRMLERTFVTVPLGELLAQDCFRRPAWSGLRASLPSITAETSGVRRAVDEGQP